MPLANTNRCIVLGRPDCPIPEPKRAPKLVDQSWPGEVTHMRRWFNQNVADITIIANLAALKPYKYANVWLEMVLRDERTFFYNPGQNITLWDRLEALMPHGAGSWQMFTKAGGINVWHNSREKKTTTTDPLAGGSREGRQRDRRSRGSNQGSTKLLKVSDITKEMFLNAMKGVNLPAEMHRAHLTKHYPALSQALFLPSDTISYELFELHVLTGLNPFLSPISRYADCRANLLLAILEHTEAIGVSDRSRALFLAWDEHMSSSSSFEKRRAYIKFLWRDWEENTEQIGNVWECPEWPRVLTPRQRREFQGITREAALALEKMRTQHEQMDDIQKAISRVFPTYSQDDPRPMRLPKARSGNHINHPSPFFSDEEFDLLKKGMLGDLKWDGTEARAANTRTTESENITTMDLEELRIGDYQSRGRQSEAREAMVDALRGMPEALSRMADMEIVDSGSEDEDEDEEDEDVDRLLEEQIGGEKDALSDPEVDRGVESGGEEDDEVRERSQMSDSEDEVSESDSDEDPYDIDGTSGLVKQAARLR